MERLALVSSSKALYLIHLFVDQGRVNNMYEYDDGEDGGTPRGRIIAAAVGVVVLALVGWFFVLPALSGDGDAGDGSVAPSAAGTDPATETEDGAESEDGDESVDADDATTATTDAPADTEPTGTTDPPSSGLATTTTAAAAVTPAVTAASTTTVAPAPPAAPPGDAPYETLPDGTPAPAIVIFETAQITLTGAVPDEAAKTRLQTLAIANAKPGQASAVANFLTINPAVPRSVGVRVVELTSTRFPEGSAEVLPAHALELDRIVAIMNALPNVSALIIGHADQRGDELTNYATSEARADAVVNYVAGSGIAASRLSSRAVGESDLLTLNNEPAALELNRRTEIVFFGLLVDVAG